MSKNKKSVLLGSLLGLFWVYVALGSRDLGHAERERQGLESFSAPRADQSSLSTAFADALLTESIVGILKKYYVEALRVENQMLLTLLVQSLAKDLHLKVQNTTEGFSLQADGNEITLQSPTNLSDDQLTTQILSLAEFVNVLSKNRSSYPDLEFKQESSIFYTLQSLLLSLDPHSNLLSANAYQELRQGTEGTFGGLGVLVGMRDQLLTVIKPLPRSPAERGGILAKDRILAIDGKDTYGYSLADLVEHMRGEPGSRVHLSMLRDGEASVQEVQLNREVILVDSVASEVQKLASGALLYVSIDSFTARTSAEILAILRTFRADLKGSKTRGILLDLRNNPGGLLDQAVKVADIFLADGGIVSTKGYSSEEEMASIQKDDELNSPLLVLINEESASASEIVAGALQDHDRALIIGQPSFGKGSVQTIFELPDDRALKLTIARYYTPSGVSIQNVGIIPDIWIQPMMKSSVNLNLFGENRYKSERFLFHSLSPQNRGLANLPDSDLPDFKGYYLKGKPTDLDEGKDLDYEREFATKIMNQLLSQTSLKKDSPTIYRANRNLKTIKSAIQKELAVKASEVNHFLRENFRLHWHHSEPPFLRGAKNTKIQPSLKLLETNNLASLPGAIISLPYVIENTQPQSLDHVSLFIRNSQHEFVTQEILVGRVAGDSQQQGALQLQVPTFWPPGRMRVQIGLAIGGQVLSQLTQEIDLQVKARSTPQLSVQVSLVSESGGQKQGVLEAGEQAKVAVSIRNQSEVGAKGVAIKLINLAGTQLRFLRPEEKTYQIKPFHQETIYFAVEGAKQLLAEKLALGLLIESKDLNLPFKQQAFIRALPSRMDAR